jgi:hypothetical protein
MNRATRVLSSVLGIYAGLIGAAHGYFETLQGNVSPTGLLISAIGLPCRSEAVWHACLPALTVIPSFLVTGIIAILFSLIVLVWAAVLIQRKNGGLVLILLSLLMLLVGGGFIPAFIGIVTGLVGTRIDAARPLGSLQFSDGVLTVPAKFWPWSLIVFVGWSLSEWIYGFFFNQIMINLSCILLFISYLGLPYVAVLSAFAKDILDRDRVV